MQRLPTLPSTPPAGRATATDVVCGDGFYGQERDELHLFRWMAPRGVLGFPPAPAERYLELWVLCQFFDLSQTLTVDAGGRAASTPLIHGWQRLSFAVAGGAGCVELELDRPFPPAYYPDDPRVLGVRVRDVLLHLDRRRHGHVARQHANAVRNTLEMLEGATVLESTPPQLGIDLHGVCNVKPPCVYCEWQGSKVMEGDNVDVPFTLETLGEYGDFFDNASLLVNCSVGEPFMLRDLDRILDAVGQQAKALELSTNGQILTDRAIASLLDRDIELYVSLDAATPETYRRLRNERFASVIDNVTRVVTAKGGRGRLPRIHFVFMPMRCNVHELEPFVELCAAVGVDRMVLRPLQRSEAIDLAWERDGYRFVYQEELLPFDELVRVSARAARLCRQHGVGFSDQLDFGGPLAELFEAESDDERAEGSVGAAVSTPPEAVVDDQPPNPGPKATEPTREAAAPSDHAAPPPLGESRLPICQEPWRTTYILRRGVLPCCYGGDRIAHMNGFREAWNSPLLQAIRRDLAAGRLNPYCLSSSACPIVQKSRHAGTMPLWQRATYGAHAWRRLAERELRRALARIHTAVAWLAIRLRAAATDPGYRRRHLARLLRRSPDRTPPRG